MCRIFYSPSSYSTFPQDILKEFLEKLEKSGGRDGNGVYLFSSETLDKKVEGMPNVKIDGKFLFHTRLGTNGKKEVYNNQPFVGDRYILVHNGVFDSITSYARLLGFNGSSNKFSDSYMIHYVIEKVGLLRFWITFKDKSVGVLVVHDKELKKTFLLKFSGCFEYCKVDKNDYLYGTSNMTFWENKEVGDMENGLYRLKADGFDTLDEKESYTYTYHYKKEKNTTTDDTTSLTKREGYVYDRYKHKYIPIENYHYYLDKSRHCSYCHNSFEKYERIYYDYGLPVCKTCFDGYGYSAYQTDRNGVILTDTLIDEEDAINIKNLFGTEEETKELCGIDNLFQNVDTTVSKLFSFCKDCKWVENDQCCFAGVRRSKPVNLRNPKAQNVLVCHSDNQDLVEQMNLKCDDCVKPISPKEDWSIMEGQIICQDCKEEYEKSSPPPKPLKKFINQCVECIFKEVDISDFPCCECITFDKKTGTYDSLKYCPEKRCENCKNYTLVEQEVCRNCESYSNWEFGQVVVRCHYCNIILEDEDEILYDKNGHPVCVDCDDFMGFNLDDDVPYYKRFYG